MAAHVPRLNQRVLTVFLLVALPVLAVGVVLVLAGGQARLNDTFGLHLQQVAQQAAAHVDTKVFGRVIDVSLLGRSPDIRREVALSSTRPFDEASARQVDQAWKTASRPGTELTALLETPTSRHLADLVAHDRVYREMLLSDRHGRLVAASSPTSDYYQADEDWWQATVDDGRRGRVTVSDVRWDESARTFAIEIAVPVYGPDDDQLSGILKVVTDSRELLSPVGGLQLGATGEALLVREDGSIVFGRRPVNADARFFATDALKARLAALRGGGTGASWFRAEGPDGRSQLVALSESQVGRSYPNLPWLLVVYQAESELAAPIAALAGYLLTLILATAAVVIGLALYFSMRLAAPAVDVDIPLERHAHVGHLGEVDEPEPRTAERAR